MYITAFFTDKGVPKTGLSPIITVRKVSDNSIVVNGLSMSEIGSGWYKYDFATYDKSIEYAIVMDANSGSISDFERYKYAGNQDDIELVDKLPTNYIMG
jgi:hypothetical protein